MKILLAQHGDAVTKDVDPDRPLSDHGLAEVGRVAQFFRRGSVQLSRVLHSGKTRARQTAELLGEGLVCSGSVEAVPDLNPNDPVDEWIKRVHTWSEDTLLVGHMPFMGRLATGLLGAAESATVVEFCPGSVLCLRRGDDSRWQVCWMIRPELAQG